MVKSDEKIDEEQKQKPLEQIKQLAEGTLFNEFLHTIQKHQWLNLAFRYGAAILVVILAFWLYSAMTVWFGPGLPTYILFYPAIIIIALLGGLGPGLVATIISVMIAGIWILPPPGQFAIT